jgi:Fe-S-cluster containining protein
MGCSASCHTQVSVTEDEAEVLLMNISSGLGIDHYLLKLQSETRDDSFVFFQMKYAERKCIFLDKAVACSVYESRPSVCRTNAVLGDAVQCDTIDLIKPIRLINTPRADIISFHKRAVHCRT